MLDPWVAKSYVTRKRRYKANIRLGKIRLDKEKGQKEGEKKDEEGT